MKKFVCQVCGYVYEGEAARFAKFVAMFMKVKLLRNTARSAKLRLPNL